MIRVMSSFIFILFSLTGVQPAHAYLDPGAGSMLLQILLGGIAGLAVFLKLFWHRILTFFGWYKPKREDTE